MILATILSTAVLAAPSDYGYKQDYFPPCKHYVDKPAWGGDGKPYGFEDGKSCIAQKWGDKSKDYGKDYKSKDYDYKPKEYGKDYDYKPKEYEPKGKDYGYESQDYGYESQDYGYESKSYAAGYDYDNEYKSEYKSEYRPSRNTHRPKHRGGYRNEYKSKDYGYKSNDYGYKNSYAADSEYKEDYKEESKDYGYETESKDYGYETESKDYGYGEEYTCESSFSYFKSTHSPTLIQCAKIACAPGQTKHYVQRALYQCYALEKQAKATNGGHLPKGW
ncbi:hypothetical protein EDD86DRAFT_205490 [Gorgonomyces haynaldii]|nr:hypothetical protein EDD86DRAFT_205490 [Gorgonomyces haynaldii]